MLLRHLVLSICKSTATTDRVRQVCDHRVMDGVTVTRLTIELDATLRREIVAERTRETPVRCRP